MEITTVVIAFFFVVIPFVCVARRRSHGRYVTGAGIIKNPDLIFLVVDGQIVSLTKIIEDNDI